MLKWFIRLLLVIGLFYAGLTCYANLTSSDGLPGPTKARYTVLIENTGGMILTNSVTQEGQTPGSRVYTVTGYWELVGKTFLYRNGTLILEEQIFGKIQVGRRK